MFSVPGEVELYHVFLGLLHVFWGYTTCSVPVLVVQPVEFSRVAPCHLLHVLNFEELTDTFISKI